MTLTRPANDDVIEPEEAVQLHGRERGKASPRRDDDELERRVEFEREEVALKSEVPGD